MAISDYLNNEEWDCCAYLFFSRQLKDVHDFGTAIRTVIAELLDSGYTFEGLDSFGEKVVQVESNNAEKLMGFMMGEPDPKTVLKIMKSGRAFALKHIPKHVKESQEAFDEQIRMVEDMTRERVNAEDNR